MALLYVQLDASLMAEQMALLSKLAVDAVDGAVHLALCDFQERFHSRGLDLLLCERDMTVLADGGDLAIFRLSIHPVEFERLLAAMGAGNA